ncbi:MAG: hypothetical protein IKU84_04885 [Clostridia bacterium]|nr:hypothetical protein [Clostridia bacterium]
MSKRLQGIIIGILICAMLTGSTALARSARDFIDAVYMNIKLVIDGEEITPKDVNGNIVEPFIYNGTTYLPVRAIGEAFDKDVHWDGENATVYVGEIVKAAKEVYLYNKPYLECETPTSRVQYRGGVNKQYRSFSNYVGFYWDAFPEKEGNTAYVTYPLNGLATKVKGTFEAPVGTFESTGAELQIKFYNENDVLLYQSPILTQITEPVNFEFECKNCLKLKVKFVVNVDDRYHEVDAAISNFRILTTDY